MFVNWNQILEFDIIEISENVCNLKKQEADWILKIDIQEQGDRLEVMIIDLFPWSVLLGHADYNDWKIGKLVRVYIKTIWCL